MSVSLHYITLNYGTLHYSTVHHLEVLVRLGDACKRETSVERRLDVAGGDVREDPLERAAVRRDRDEVVPSPYGRRIRQFYSE